MSTDAFTTKLQEELHRDADGEPAAAVSPHVCRACSRPFVQPIAAREVDDWHFDVDLRCANCGWAATETYDDEALEQLDRGLDEGTRVLLEAYETLALDNARQDFERIATALRAGALLPEDF
jgi:hypothetical protein